jgi:hypothetical protein
MRYKWTCMHQASTAATTIYVRLLEEATTCLRPTEAVPLADGTYRVLPTTDYDPTDEVWEFAPGSTVHCESFDGQSGPYLLAIAEVGVDGSKKRRATFAVSEDVLEYRDERGHLLWRLKPEDIVLVAEYTTNEGPFGDDWFLVFAVANKIPYFMTCSVYSDGRDTALEFLRTRFAIEPKLTNSTEWKSVVLWPKVIAGATLIEFSQREPRNWRERFRAWFDGFIRQPHLSAAVHQYLQSLSQ